MEVTLLRIFLTPVLVLVIYFLQRKWGARVGGLFLGLPINITPFLIIIYLQESNEFFETAIHGVFIGQIVLLKTWPKTSASSDWQEPTNWDLPFRLVATSLTVFLLTTFSYLLGPTVSGTFSAYPVILTFLGSLSHRRNGPAHILKTLQGMIYLLPLSYGIFLFLLALV